MSIARKLARGSIAAYTILVSIRCQMRRSIGGQIDASWSVFANTGSDTLILTRSCVMSMNGYMAAMGAAQKLQKINKMDTITYRQEYCYEPIIPYIWILLDRLDKKGLLIPKLLPAVKMPPKQSFKK